MTIKSLSSESEDLRSNLSVGLCKISALKSVALLTSVSFSPEQREA